MCVGVGVGVAASLVGSGGYGQKARRGGGQGVLPVQRAFQIKIKIK